MSKFYFYDAGLRNALIENFQPLNSRPDYGVLFENFLISEILKINSYLDLGLRMHFWRTKQGSEIDLVLINTEGKIWGVEIKTGNERDNHAQKFLLRKSKNRQSYGAQTRRGGQTLMLFWQNNLLRLRYI